VVSNRQGGHAVLYGHLNEIIQAAGSIEKGVLAVRVQMYEIGVLHGIAVYLLAAVIKSGLRVCNWRQSGEFGVWSIFSPSGKNQDLDANRQ